MLSTPFLLCILTIYTTSTVIAEIEDELSGKHLSVVATPLAPFGFFPEGISPRNKSDVKTDGTEMIGFGIDLTNRVAEMLNFSYTLYMTPDGAFGSKNSETGKWNGMVKELYEKTADLTASAFTINKVRAQAIDFSTPVLDVGLKITLPRFEEKTDTMSFLKPFSPRVWGLLIFNLIAVGIIIGLLERLSPYGFHGEFTSTHHNIEFVNSNRRNRKQFHKEKKRATAMMSFHNALWYSCACLIQQGYDGHPQAPSSRIIVVAWWFATSIFIATYTGKISSTAIATRLTAEINTVSDLLAQDEIKYGAVEKTSMADFLCKNKIDIYSKLCDNMKKWDSFVPNFTYAVQQMNDPNAKIRAYVVGSPIADSLAMKKPCTTRAMDQVFNKGGFGIGLQKGSPYTKAVSIAVLRLREEGFMNMLYKKWITGTSECKPILKGNDLATTKQTLANFAGIFYIIYGAVFISPLLLITEFTTFLCRKSSTSNTKSSARNQILNAMKRFKTDVFVYSLPEFLKSSFSLDQFSNKNLRLQWETKAQAYRMQILQRKISLRD